MVRVEAGTHHCSSVSHPVFPAGLNGARGLGVEPMMTAAELSDPNIDHLAVMALLSKFVHLTPPTPNPEKLTLNCSLQDVKQGAEVTITTITI